MEDTSECTVVKEGKVIIKTYRVLGHGDMCILCLTVYSVVKG